MSADEYPFFLIVQAFFLSVKNQNRVLMVGG